MITTQWRLKRRFEAKVCQACRCGDIIYYLNCPLVQSSKIMTCLSRLEFNTVSVCVFDIPEPVMESIATMSTLKM